MFSLHDHLGKKKPYTGIDTFPLRSTFFLRKKKKNFLGPCWQIENVSKRWLKVICQFMQRHVSIRLCFVYLFGKRKQGMPIESFYRYCYYYITSQM